ncbi:sensor domain-containing protein [Microvirga arabica]|uniref:sensor domain-containing protein n=1 Tax=Microvirga arabica TaxID=1128671 RepID=UPI001939E33C|nr:PAS domain-containing protein [Microvirga arabica]MBM1173436.1 EAL domain-containing protein [Microvirga arabica]
MGKLVEIARGQNNGVADLSAFADTLPHMTWIASADGKHEYRNRRFYEFTGAAPGSIDDNGWNSVAHPDDQEQAAEKWCHAIRTGEPYEAEYRLRHHTGEYRWVRACALPARDGYGRIERWLGTSTDVHDQKQGEAALRESEGRYRALVEASTAKIWRATPNGAISTTWGWEKVSGQHLDQQEDAGWLNAVHPDDRANLISVWQGLLASSRPGTTEYRVRQRDGQYRWALARAVPIKEADGTVQEWVGTITDIHEQKQAENALRKSEARLRLAIETTGLGIWDVDVTAGNRQWTAEIREILGISSDTPATRDTALERVHSADRARVESIFYADEQDGCLNRSAEYRILRADSGEERWVLETGRTFLGEDNQPIRKLGTIQDITERKRSQEALRESEERLRLAMQAARMVAWEQDLRTGYITRSQNSLALLGIGSGPLSEFLDKLHPDDRTLHEKLLSGSDDPRAESTEFRYTLPTGKTLWLASRAERAGPNRIVGVSYDITDRKAAEEEIWRAANHDALTGLPNRALFQHSLEEALTRAKQDGTSVSLLLIDLDDFKDVNDTLGHDAGDALLKETAARLSAVVRECDTAGRLGGDEFAILIVEPMRLSNAVSFADNIIRQIRQPFTYNGRMIVSRASIGVAAFPDHDILSSELMKDADIALYQAKAKGRGGVVTYSPAMRETAERRLTLSREVREAITRDEIVPFYQPKVCLATGRVVGLEALARWHHPTKGLLTPSTFGMAFDDPEIATALGKRLIGKIASDIRTWLKAGLSPGRVAVNLSNVEFSRPDLAEEIFRILDLARIPTTLFEVEVTEKVLLDGRSGLVADTLDKLRRRGIQVALDDFGTGYASLTHLKRFPVDHIKIDQSFVRDLEEDTGDEAIVAALIGLAKSLNLLVTAEGVETEGQARRLSELGCHTAQGYLFARPMAAAEMTVFISHQT